ncbi:MAG: hypothetical protein PWP16_1251 [Eubacteriaceae bacterium]|jgi:hypothetical protein|nr:hypothetical protein [Eubacteriaceae bacterium]MDK2904675.1 hypothetical protein [Eubacteriaceae bacterium]MDK2937575.1 hypothetical protein [Eubacteriaceae bacterium]MDN5307888.1 hypothetical protein [Eubacteriaceae bacterium]
MGINFQRYYQAALDFDGDERQSEEEVMGKKVYCEEISRLKISNI